jgi:choline dehydrogenase
MSETAYDAEFDYVIVGAGSAGAALAHRLSESGDHSVRVLEYGGSDNSIFIKMPTAFSIPMNMKRYDWGFHSEKEPGLKGRSLHQARGKVLGGSSSINGLVYVRGCAGDFEEWEELGAAGWGYQDVLPYFKRGEDCVYGGDAYRGDQGGLTTCNGNNMKNPLYRAFIKAGEQAGYGYTEDYNGYRQEGFGRMAYLKPAMNRPNLDIQTHALTTRVIMDGKTAVGVEYRQGGKTRRVRARKEVILSASSFNSPKLLMLSGIGPADHLKEHGIEVVHDLPGVGRNLQDHLEVWVQQECTQKITLNSWLGPLAKAWIGANWLFLKRGLGTSNQFESNGYIRSRAGMKYPDIQFHFLAGAIAYDGSSAFKGHGFQVHLGANKPKSRGWVKLKSADPEAPPEIVFNYFAEEEDKEAFRAGLRWTREIFAQPALDEYRGKEVSPGPDVQTDAQIDQWLAETAETAYHPAGSCRMGTDAMAVVDPECRVHGVRNLRVVDSSIMPTVTNGNLNAPTIMIGEKAADHILGRTPLRSDAPSFAPDDWQTSQRVSAPERTV